MKRIIHWLKKDPLIHGLFLILLTIFAGLLIIGGFFLFVFIRLSDPNYIEFGPRIDFYKSKECAMAFEGSSRCSFGGQAVLNIYKNNPPKFSDSISKLVRVDTKNYPRDPNLWHCMVNGRIIEDKNEKLIIGEGQTVYQCWPK